MSAHAKQPEPRNEALLAVYSHAASNPVAEWPHRYSEGFAAVAVFLLVLAMSEPMLAVILAFALAGLMIGAGIVMSLRDAKGTCHRTIREVQAREAEQ